MKAKVLTVSQAAKYAKRWVKLGNAYEAGRWAAVAAGIVLTKWRNDGLKG